MKTAEIRELLEKKASTYNHPSFIETDPISIPHLFSRREDIEIAGFLVATISWGQRPVILKNGLLLMQLLDHAPYQFIIGFKDKDLLPFRTFTHRTFNGIDCISFLKALKHIYLTFPTLENAFVDDLNVANQGLDTKISNFHRHFFSIAHQSRTEKHLSDPFRNSACKRLNMFLRWMVRKDKNGVDFGIWNTIHPSELMLPLDVHTGRVARSLGLLKRQQDDWKAVLEVTAKLRQFDNQDPVKYDYALFGLGVFEKYK